MPHIPHKSYTAQINYATAVAVFYFPFADPARIFRGHMLKPFCINANTRTFRSMLICIYAGYTYIHTYIHTHIHIFLALALDNAGEVWDIQTRVHTYIIIHTSPSKRRFQGVAGGPWTKDSDSLSWKHCGLCRPNHSQEGGLRIGPDGRKPARRKRHSAASSPRSRPSRSASKGVLLPLALS